MAALAGAAWLTLSAFDFRTRREIGERDNWTCQCGCRRGKNSGHHVNAAHYPDLHTKDGDTNPDNGRILTTECHIVEELRRGNLLGARSLYRTQTIMSYQWIAAQLGKKQVDLTPEDIATTDLKESFQYYVDLADIAIEG